MNKAAPNHLTSLRLPKEWHLWVTNLAASWNATPSYVYRCAIRDFIRAKAESKK